MNRPGLQEAVEGILAKYDAALPDDPVENQRAVIRGLIRAIEWVVRSHEIQKRAGSCIEPLIKPKEK